MGRQRLSFHHHSGDIQLLFIQYSNVIECGAILSYITTSQIAYTTHLQQKLNPSFSKQVARLGTVSCRCSILWWLVVAHWLLTYALKGDNWWTMLIKGGYFMVCIMKEWHFRGDWVHHSCLVGLLGIANVCRCVQIWPDNGFLKIKFKQNRGSKLHVKSS